jgi:hypothetical protein
MKNLKVIALSALAFVTIASMVFVSCQKDSELITTPTTKTVKNTRSPKITGTGYFTWQGWGHNEDIKDLDGNVIFQTCPGAGLCRFKVKKVKGSVSRKTAQLQEDEGGYFIDILIDDDFPMSEINNFRITNTMTERDEDGNRFTLFAGLYPYNASINGYRLPVLVNPI